LWEEDATWRKRMYHSPELYSNKTRWRLVPEVELPLTILVGTLHRIEPIQKGTGSEMNWYVFLVFRRV
jgi:hypothetical protein